jgi:hypothetical protein
MTVDKAGKRNKGIAAAESRGDSPDSADYVSALRRFGFENHSLTRLAIHHDH